MIRRRQRAEYELTAPLAKLAPWTDVHAAPYTDETVSSDAVYFVEYIARANASSIVFAGSQIADHLEELDAMPEGEA